MSNKINKTAYPQGQYFSEIHSYDINKWIRTLNMISLYARQGYNFRKTCEQLTKDWDDMEKNDFNHWMKYYQGNNQNSYKTANLEHLPKYLEVAPGALVPNDLNDLKPKIKLPEEQDPQFQINKKIKSIINRLMAAERLATDPEVQKELSKRLDIGLHKWLEELQRIKRLVQVAPIKHAKSTILEDLIVKEALILANKGFPKTANELIKVAQVAPVPPGPAPGPGLPPTGLPAPDAPIAAPSPAPTPGPMPGPSSPAEGSEEESEEKGEEALKQFVKHMNPLPVDKNKEDKNSVVDLIDYDDDEEPDDLADIFIQAQAIPPEMTATAPSPVPATAPATAPMQAGTAPAATAPALTPDIEVSEEQPGMEFADTNLHQKTDDLLDRALSGITVNDVIERLDALVNLFRTREIPRQLAIIDLMMDQLNLSSFFPGLAEASSKSLESNQYALSRIEEVLSKLKGSIKTPKDQEFDLLGGQEFPANTSPEVSGIRNSLQEQENKEKARKQQKKQEELNKATPAMPMEMQQDLSQPVQISPGAAPIPPSGAVTPTVPATPTVV